jgi:hypothetical protein
MSFAGLSNGRQNMVGVLRRSRHLSLLFDRAKAGEWRVTFKLESKMG